MTVCLNLIISYSTTRCIIDTTEIFIQMSSDSLQSSLLEWFLQSTMHEPFLERKKSIMYRYLQGHSITGHRLLVVSRFLEAIVAPPSVNQQLQRLQVVMQKRLWL